MKKSFYSFVALFVAFAAFGQNQVQNTNMREGESVEYCLQHKKMNALKQNPAFVLQNNADQLEMQNVQISMAADENPLRLIYKIPVVFHVLHNGGVENISNAQIMDALEVLNRDYRLLNPDAANVASAFNASNPSATSVPTDIEVEFVLATKAPNGECFSGITRTQSSQSYSGDGQAQLNAIVAGNDVYNGQWPGNKYLNIFICGDIGGAAGYTYTPSNWIGTAMANGIYILHDYVGRIGTGHVGTDRALTHEVGHWLNLEHVWGGNNDPGSGGCDTQNDFIQDTPQTVGSTACLLSANTCTGDNAYWGFNQIDNVENYMDYSYCSKMFTPGQKARMVAALNSSVGGRNNVWTSTNLTATGADGNAYLCAADFYSDRIKICAGDSINFFDNSYHNVVSWNWTFQGGSANATNIQNPTVFYANPGVYNVSLTVSDGNTSLTKTMNGYITVTAAGATLPFLDGFETYTSLGTSGYWEVDNQQNNATFEVTTTAAHTGSKSVKLANFGQAGTNVDELIANPVNLSAITSTGGVTLSFRFAYRKRVSTNAEKLYVLFTGNCGESWEIRKSIQGSSLGSTVVSTAWTPAAQTDWTTVHCTNITSQYWNQNFRYKFRFEGSGGNNLYLDNINIYASGPSEELVGGNTGVDELESATDISIYPNPADKEVNVSYNVANNTKTEISITDILGKKIQTFNIQSLEGNNLVVLSTEELASGTYMIEIVSNGVKTVRQIQVR